LSDMQSVGCFEKAAIRNYRQKSSDLIDVHILNIGYIDTNVQ